MKPKYLITALLGGLLLVGGLALSVVSLAWYGLVPSLIGGSLLYVGYRPGRGATIVFGHACIVAGCLLVTWGIYLLPYSEPTLAHIVGRPLFWGLIAILGGICANYHGFCRCVSAATESMPACALPSDAKCAAPNSRPVSQLPASPEAQPSDSQRMASSGGCG